MKKIEKRKPPPCARRAAARPRAKIAPLFWWGFLRGFLIVSRRRSECFRASVSARFLVMAKNSGGYFSITNFLTVSHGLARSARVFALSVCFSAYRPPLSRRSCRLCGVLLRVVCVCLSVVVSSLVWLFLPVLRGVSVAVLSCVRLWRDILPAVACLGGRSYVFPPALLSCVYGRFMAFCGGASDCIRKTPHGGGVSVSGFI